MELIARQHGTDPEQIELFTNDRGWLFAVVHIDHFSDLGITERLQDGEEIVLKITA